MSDESQEKPPTGKKKFSNHVGEKATRKLKAQQDVTQTVWSGLGMMGMIGWSVAVPTLIGAAVGIWLDNHYPGERSWTLMMMALGLGLGCFNAWHWVAKEYREIHEKEDKRNE